MSREEEREGAAGWGAEEAGKEAKEGGSVAVRAVEDSAEDQAEVDLAEDSAAGLVGQRLNLPTGTRRTRWSGATAWVAPFP